MKKPKPRLVCTYLYQDCHAVCLYEKTDADAGLVEYVEIHEKFIKGACAFKGRITFGRYSSGLVALISGPGIEGIEAREPNIDRGTDATRRLGLRVGSLHIHTKAGEIYFNYLPDLISGQFSYQPEAGDEKFDPEAYHWCNWRVARVHRVKQACVV